MRFKKTVSCHVCFQSPNINCNVLFVKYGCKLVYLTSSCEYSRMDRFSFHVLKIIRKKIQPDFHLSKTFENINLKRITKISNLLLFMSSRKQLKNKYILVFFFKHLKLAPDQNRATITNTFSGHSQKETMTGIPMRIRKQGSIEFDLLCQNIQKELEGFDFFNSIIARK